MDLDVILPRAENEADADPGVTGNSRLTSTTGLLLTVLLLVEGFTILDVRGYISLHTFIGLTLLGPVALKSGATMYRFARYYTGDPAYVRRGAPPLVLRLLGPLMILTTLALLGTGVGLLIVHGGHGTLLTLHQASFFAWIAVTGIHFLAHIVEAVRHSAHELTGRAGPAQRRRALRGSVLLGSLAVGLVVAAVFTPAASSWHDGHGFGPGHVGPPGPHGAAVHVRVR